MTWSSAPIVFLHIPKTAGQTIHNALVKLVGGQEHCSPVRVHTQARAEDQMPPGYRLYSGHIDWISADTLPKESFIFSVLRDPRERIASFYLYLLKEAQALSDTELNRPERAGMRRILQVSADDYFFGGDANWQRFIRDHYDNVYCSYFATRRMRASHLTDRLCPAEEMNRARIGLGGLGGLYTVDRLDLLERDLTSRYGYDVRLTGQYHNTGTVRLDQARWPILMSRLESDTTRHRLETFVQRDEILWQEVKRQEAANTAQAVADPRSTAPHSVKG